MAEADPDDALQGEWLRQYSAWRAGIVSAYAVIQQILVKVLVWGPGRHSAEYPKRHTILEHIAAQSPQNQARTSEDLLDEFPPPDGLTEYEAEEIHWRNADIVFAVIARDSTITGSRAEIAKWGDDLDFVNKSYLFTPRLTKRQREKIGFLDLGWQRFPTERKFEYTDAEYRDCTRMRAYCADAVQRLRSRRGFQNWRQSRR
ncbi:MAG: hypothetical protein ACYDCQ_13540 [Dehalococcoidia bacterium]